MSKSKKSTRTSSRTRFQVTVAGEDNWKDVEAANASEAGEAWAEANWGPEDGETTYELDVKEPGGKLVAVTVDVDVSVTFSGFASKHPCEEVA